MKTTCTVKVKFTAAHRLAGKDIPCEALHGHYYEVSFTFAAERLEGDMIVEFEDAERRLQSWFSDNWDHNVILSDADKELGDAISKITKQKVFYYTGCPTAENLAGYLLNVVAPKLFADTNGKCVKVRLDEYSKGLYSCEVEL